MSRENAPYVPYRASYKETFNEKTFLEHAARLFGSVDASQRRIHSGLFIPASHRACISSYTFLGRHNNESSGGIDVLLVKLTPGVSVEQADRSCRGLLDSYMHKRGASGVLCAVLPSAERSYTVMLTEASSLLRLKTNGPTAEFLCLEAIKNLIEKKSGLTRKAIDGYFSKSVFLYDDILIARAAPALDKILSDIQFCDIACGGGELVVRMAEAIAEARESLNKYLPAGATARDKNYFIKHFIEHSLYAADSTESAPVLLRALLKLRYPCAEVQDSKVKWGSVLLEDVFDGRLFDAIVTVPPHLRGEHIAPIKNLLSGFLSNKYNADIYCYYIEKALSMLNGSGSALILASDRWMKASYGAGLREFFAFHPPRFAALLGAREDITGTSIRMCALSCFAEPQSSDTVAVEAQDLQVDANISDFVCERMLSKTETPDTTPSITILPDSRSSIIRKIRQNSVFLSTYVENKIYRGILTGLNEAFVTDSSTYDAMSSPDSKEHLVPFYTGREVKRWALPPSKKRLIYFQKGFTKEHSGNSEPLQWFADNYNDIARRLAPFEERAEKRRDKGDYWWELRSCRYTEIFKRNMIVLPGITKKLSAALAPAGSYFNDKCSIIGTDDYFILALLNSKLMDFIFRQSAPELLNGYFELRPSQLSELPLCRFSRSNTNMKLKEEVETCAQKLHAAYLDEPRQKYGRQNPTAVQLEKHIDSAVCRLYGLTAEERSVIENH